MMLSLLLSRVLGIARDTVMAAYFGVGPETDAYRLAFQIPDLIFFAVAGGALSSAFIPVFSEYFHTDRKEEAWKVFSVVTCAMSLILLALIALAWVYAVPLAAIVAPGKSPEMHAFIAQMSRILLPAQLAFFVGGLMFGTLYARQVFAIPGLGPNVYNLGIIFGAVAISQFVQPGIVGMAWGATIGAILGNLVIPMIAMARMGFHFYPSLDMRHPGVKKVFRLMLPVVLGLSLPGVYGLIMQMFGSFYADGINTALDLANKLMQAPLGIFGQSLALAVFPTLSQLFAEKKMDVFGNQISATLRTATYISVPISVGMAVLAPEIVTILFMYGKARGADLGPLVLSLRLFSVGIFAWCLHPTLMRGFFAIQQTVTPVVVGTITTGVFVGLAFALRATELSYGALPLASSISAIVLAAMMLISLRAKVEGIQLGSILATLGKSGSAAIVMGAMMFGLTYVSPQGTGLGQNALAFLKLALIGGIGGLIYVGLTRKLGMKEASVVDRALGKFKR